MRRTIRPATGIVGRAPDGLIAVEELLAFLVKWGYRFGPAKPDGEAFYKALYGQMVQYYMDLHTVQVAMERSEQEGQQKIAKLEQDADELLRSSRWDPTQDVIAVLTAKPPENILDYAHCWPSRSARRPRPAQLARGRRPPNAAGGNSRWATGSRTGASRSGGAGTADAGPAGADRDDHVAGRPRRRPELAADRPRAAGRRVQPHADGRGDAAPRDGQGTRPECVARRDRWRTGRRCTRRCSPGRADARAWTAAGWRT